MRMTYIMGRMNNTNTKAMIDNEMAYFFGLDRGSYGEVLGDLSRTWVHSFRTSSIPLAEFWQPANLDVIRKLLAPHLPGFNPEEALKFFEFPTYAVWNGERIGRPSMTDIMVLDGEWQMAVEGKFTEYVFAPEKTIVGQLQECSTVEGLRLRRNVIKAWYCYIRAARCTDIASPGDLLHQCPDVGYQFLHRTASACHAANGLEGRTPVLVYQLFFDQADAAHEAAMVSFKENLRKWASQLRLKNMKFLIVTVPVTNFADVKRRFDGQHGEIFYAMRDEDVYRFDLGGTTVESVINGDAAKNE